MAGMMNGLFKKGSLAPSRVEYTVGLDGYWMVRKVFSFPLSQNLKKLFFFFFLIFFKTQKSIDQ